MKDQFVIVLILFGLLACTVISCESAVDSYQRKQKADAYFQQQGKNR